MKNLIASLTLICCASVAMAISAAPCDGDKKAQCEAARARAAQVAQVSSECQAAKAQAVAQVKSSECQASKAVAQVVSQDQKQCCAAARKAQAVAQVASSVRASQCSKSKAVAQVVSSECQASKAAKAAQVAQVTGNSQCCPYASKAKGVAQVASSPQCQASKTAQVAQVTGTPGDAPQCSKAAQVKYVAYNCEVSDRLARVAATSYIDFMTELKAAGGAEGCALSASAKTLQALYSDEKTDPCYGCEYSDRLAKSVAVGYVKFMGELKSIAGYEGCAYDASMKTLAAVIDDTVAEAQAQAAVEVETTTEVSLGAVSDSKQCGPDCTKACCTG